jgi:hypothetical protein
MANNLHSSPRAFVRYIIKPMGRRLLTAEEAAPRFWDDAAPRNGMMLPPIPR